MSTTPCYPEKALKIDDLLDVLAHYLRREVVNYFENHAGTPSATLEELAAHVESRVPRSFCTDVTAELHHLHIPKLQSAGWLKYETRTHEVSYHGHEPAAEWTGEVHAMF